MFVESGTYKNLTATGSVTAKPGYLIGFYVNSTNAGTLALTDGQGGTALGGTITPAAGAFHRLPATFLTGLYATIGGTALDVTFFYVAGANN